MKTCIKDQCDLPVEGHGDFCASHARLNRKISKQRVATAEKREQHFSKPMEPRAKPKKVSDKRRVENEIYRKLRKEYLLDHAYCEMKLIGCERTAIEIHHTASRGKNLNEVSTWKATCRHCHDLLHNKLSAKEARDKGLKTNTL